MFLVGRVAIQRNGKLMVINPDYKVGEEPPNACFEDICSHLGTKNELGRYRANLATHFDLTWSKNSIC